MRGYCLPCLMWEQTQAGIINWIKVTGIAAGVDAGIAAGVDATITDNFAT